MIQIILVDTVELPFEVVKLVLKLVLLLHFINHVFGQVLQGALLRLLRLLEKVTKEIVHWPDVLVQSCFPIRVASLSIWAFNLAIFTESSGYLALCVDIWSSIRSISPSKVVVAIGSWSIPLSMVSRSICFDLIHVLEFVQWTISVSLSLTSYHIMDSTFATRSLSWESSAILTIRVICGSISEIDWKS